MSWDRLGILTVSGVGVWPPGPSPLTYIKPTRGARIKPRAMTRQTDWIMILWCVWLVALVGLVIAIVWLS
jgi:uncharacterized iron-regulated membrane protein